MKKSSIAIIATGVGVILGGIIGFIAGRNVMFCDEFFDDYDDFDDNDIDVANGKSWIDLTACHDDAEYQEVDTESLPTLDADNLEKMQSDIDKLTDEDIFG